MDMAFVRLPNVQEMLYGEIISQKARYRHFAFVDLCPALLSVPLSTSALYLYLQIISKNGRNLFLKIKSLTKRIIYPKGQAFMIDILFIAYCSYSNGFIYSRC
jgi:hypothetical protein